MEIQREKELLLMTETTRNVEREEQKYLLSELAARKLSGKLSELLDADSHNGFDGYTVRSLYFDTIDDRDFYDKEDGVETRRKIRLRCYPPDYGQFKLELKEKNGNYQRKRSLTLSREDAERLAEGQYSLLAGIGGLALELYLTMTTEVYCPKSVVEYDREAYTMPSNDIRLTFDRQIRASESPHIFFAPTEQLYSVIEHDIVVFEVKFNHFIPRYVKQTMSDYSKIQTSSSKYWLSRNIGH
jgi:hypothetical protein